MTITTSSTILPVTGAWELDKSHSSVEFSVRHLMVSKVKGAFEDFDATVEAGDRPETSSVTASVRLASVNTGDAKRDEHLRSPDFFNVDANPEMVFRSTSIVPNGDHFKLHGDLTILGRTLPATFDVEFNGVAADPWGGTRAGFSATGEISRSDFGLEWNVALEAGGVLVGDKVKIALEVELIQPSV